MSVKEQIERFLCFFVLLISTLLLTVAFSRPGIVYSSEKPVRVENLQDKSAATEVQPPDTPIPPKEDWYSQPTGQEGLTGHQAAQKSTSKPSGIDLDVTYVSRTPRYPYDGVKQWPNVGENVTFTAHIMNKGSEQSGSFSYNWFVDGQNMGSGTINNLLPEQEKTRSLSWSWQEGRHTIRFIVDSDNQVAETFEHNNVREDVSDALTFAFWVEESVYERYNNLENDFETYSWEDWAQQIIDHLNYLFEVSRYPQATKGVLTRVRLDSVTMVEDNSLPAYYWLGAPDDLLFDVSLGFRVSEYGYGIPMWNPDWMVPIHEACHKLFGLVDLYAFNVSKEEVLVTNDHGDLIAGTPDLPLIDGQLVYTTSRPYDVMASPVTADLVFSDHSTEALNQYWPQGVRSIPAWAGSKDAFGRYILDMPSDTKLRILAQDDKPLSGIEVHVYQAEQGSGPDYYSKVFDDIADSTTVTDKNGTASLGARPFGNSMYESHPFQRITTGIALIKLHDPVAGTSQYHWLEITPLNLAYWHGDTDETIHDIYSGTGDSQVKLSEDTVHFIQGSANQMPAPQTVAVNIIGDAPRLWEPSLPQVSWLTIVPGVPPTYGYKQYPSGPLTFRVDGSKLPPGSLSTTIEISPAGGAGSGKVREVTVNLEVMSEPPEANFGASPDRGAPPLTVEFTNLSTGDFDQCLWDFGDGDSSNICDNPKHAYLKEGNYTVSLAVKGSGGEDTMMVEQCINVAYFRLYLPGILHN